LFAGGGPRGLSEACGGGECVQRSVGRMNALDPFCILVVVLVVSVVVNVLCFHCGVDVENSKNSKIQETGKIKKNQETSAGILFIILISSRFCFLLKCDDFLGEFDAWLFARKLCGS
jgi:hypothetical protein